MLAADCADVDVGMMPGDVAPDDDGTVATLPDDTLALESMPFETCYAIDPAIDASWQEGSWPDGSWPDDSWPDDSWPDDSGVMVSAPIDIRTQFISSDTGWASYSYVVDPDGSVAGISVVASYDEPTIAAFVDAHREDGSVQIVDLGDCWWIDRFPADLAPPVPDAGVCFFAGLGGGIAFAAAGGDVGPLERFGEDAPITDDTNTVDAGLDTEGNPILLAYGSPIWSAGADASLPVFDDGVAFDASLPLVDDVDAASPRSAVDEPTPALDPRAAAFADVRMLFAAAWSGQGVGTEAAVLGGGRRRR